jgi:hypothetical protein
MCLEFSTRFIGRGTRRRVSCGHTGHLESDEPLDVVAASRLGVTSRNSAHG